jgi:magnesium-transporting ATPase (P-type)
MQSQWQQQIQRQQAQRQRQMAGAAWLQQQRKKKAKAGKPPPDTAFKNGDRFAQVESTAPAKPKPRSFPRIGVLLLCLAVSVVVGLAAAYFTWTLSDAGLPSEKIFGIPFHYSIGVVAFLIVFVKSIRLSRKKWHSSIVAPAKHKPRRFWATVVFFLGLWLSIRFGPMVAERAFQILEIEPPVQAWIAGCFCGFILTLLITNIVLRRK